MVISVQEIACLSRGYSGEIFLGRGQEHGSYLHSLSNATVGKIPIELHNLKSAF